MASPLKIGFIGSGMISGIHCDAIAGGSAAEVVALSDSNPDALTKLADKAGVSADRCYADYRDMLATDLDAVMVCVPNFLHAEATLAALAAGKHVLCEKPMATNAADARDMADAAKAASKILQIAMVQRFDQQAQVAKQMSDAGDLGEIYHVRSVMFRRRGIPGLGRWFTTKAKSGGGCLADVGVHWLDLSLHLGGLWNPTAVSAKTYAKFGVRMENYVYDGMWAGPPDFEGVCDVEDYATGMVRFGDSATLTFEIAWAANGPDTSFVEVLGTGGGLRVLDDKPLTVLTEQNGRVVDVTVDTKNVAGGFGTQIENFAAACRGSAAPATTAEQGATLCGIIEGIYASSDTNREVVL